MVLKVLESTSICVPNTSVYSKVEIRSYKSDSDSDIEKLKISAESARLDFSNYSYSSRIATLVESNHIEEAINLADDRFAEILDLKSIEASISDVSLSPIGLTKNMATGETHPIQLAEYQPSMAFMVHKGDVQRFDLINYVLSLESDLSKRYLRSLHWSRNGRHEKNPQLRILYDWFSIEALLKESESDNIGGSIRWFLGFPNGKSELEVSVHIKNSLNTHPKYEFWKKRLPLIIDKIRIFRNDSVHSGFRGVDFKKDELDLYSKVTRFGSSRCQSAVQLALINRIETVSEFKEYISSIFEENSNLVNDIHGNIIYNLEKSAGT